MAYCSYCAAVLDAGQPVCSRCGRPTPAASAFPERPASINLAVILILVSSGISLISFVSVLFATSGRSFGLPATFLFRSVVFLILWIAFAICIWQRQNWARFAILVLLAYGAGNLLLTSLRVPINWGFALTLIIIALRLGAIVLMFKPESNTWFNKRS